MNEFEIIQRYFSGNKSTHTDEVILGIGDDAAIICPAADSQLVISVDTLVEAVHFSTGTAAEDIAYKAVAVNISDMAAMGAVPRWMTLSLTLPAYQPGWLQAFSTSLATVLKDYSIELIGGDLARGPLSITVQMHGTIPKTTRHHTSALTRSGAHAGDHIYVTGKLGMAAAALQAAFGNTSPEIQPAAEEIARLNRPKPRLETGIALRDVASSCIDISDGLIADLGHILSASQAGAEIWLPSIPYADSLKHFDSELATETIRQLVLSHGDDYELCFTLPPSADMDLIESLQASCPLTHIGMITNSHDCVVLDKANQPVQLMHYGHRHFAD